MTDAAGNRSRFSALVVGFATADCVQQFKSRPSEYVKP